MTRLEQIKKELKSKVEPKHIRLYVNTCSNEPNHYYREWVDGESVVAQFSSLGLVLAELGSDYAICKDGDIIHIKQSHLPRNIYTIKLFKN